MKRLILAVFAALALSACTTGQLAGQVNHQWSLTTLDGQAVTEGVNSTLEFRDNGTQISGRAGCNRFFGVSNLKDGHIGADKLGVTLMACSPAAQTVENAVLDTLKDAKVTLANGKLTIKGGNHTLVYQQAK